MDLPPLEKQLLVCKIDISYKNKIYLKVNRVIGNCHSSLITDDGEKLW